MQSQPRVPGGTTARLDDAGAGKRAGPHLIVTGTGARISLPQMDEIFIGRVDPHTTLAPDVDLGEHGGGMAGVSRSHARVRDGDLVRCGQLLLTFHEE